MSKAKEEIDISKITVEEPNKIENSSQDGHSIDKFIDTIEKYSS